ncbi:hypothetical protein Tco_1173985 [Tanacetum coccineum]
MTLLVAISTLDSANFCVMQGASCTQREVSMVFLGRISPNSFCLYAAVGGIVDVVVFSFIFKLSFVLIDSFLVLEFAMVLVVLLVLSYGMIHEDGDNDAISGNDDERAINNIVEEEDEETDSLLRWEVDIVNLDMTSLKWSVLTTIRWDTLQGNAEDLGTKIAEIGIKTALEEFCMADDEVPTNMALMDFLNSEFNKSEFNLATYKRGLASVEEQLVFYKKNELEKLKQEKESNQLKIEKFDNASKSLDKLIGSQIPDKNRKEEFQQPKFEGYGPKTSKSVSEDTSNEVRESLDASLVKELVSNYKLKKKTIFPTVAKINFVRPQQQEKPVRKLVNFDHVQANCNYHQKERMVSENNYTRVNYNYSAKKAHPSAHRNIVPRAVLMKTGLRPLNTARPKAVNTARPNSAVVNAVRANQGHPQKEDQGYVDSGYSRNMTGNMSYLLDFKEFDEGYVAFIGGTKGGKITGKGTLKISKLDFEDVYFVKEL